MVEETWYTLPRDSEREFRLLVEILGNNKDYKTYILADGDPYWECWYEVARSYVEFRVRIRQDDAPPQELWFEHFGDVLRAIELAEMVKDEWKEATAHEFDATSILSELDRLNELAQKKTPKERYAEYLQTEHWKAIRKVALQRARYRCQVCNSKYRLQVHHRTYERLGNELPEDLTVLCDACHELYERHKRLPSI